MITVCPFCKAKAAPEDSRCKSCGKTMTRACPACAETIAANSSICKYCGEGVTAKPEPVRPSPHPGIVFLEERPRKNCCPGRSMFWLMVALFLGVCAYSAVRSQVKCHRTQPVKQTIQAPAKDF